MLQTTGKITLSDIRTELGTFGQTNMGRVDSRALAAKPSGAIKMSDFRGKWQDLPQIEAYLYDSTTAFNAFTASFTPPTNQQIFNTWGRFSANSWFPSGTTPTGEATAWMYDSTLGRCVCTANTATVVGFVSTELLDNYVLETTLSSTNADDDTIGVIASFKNDGTNNIYVYVARVNYSTNNWVMRVVKGTTATTLVNGTNAATMGFQNSALQGWAASGPTRVKIQRSGNLLSAMCSPFGSLTYDASTYMSFDLTTNVNTALLVGKQSYGYLAASQNAATFSDSVLSGGLNAGTAYNTVTGQVKTYNPATGLWEVQAATIAASLGYPRKVLNPETGILFSISPTGVITRV